MRKPAKSHALVTCDVTESETVSRVTISRAAVSKHTAQTQIMEVNLEVGRSYNSQDAFQLFPVKTAGLTGFILLHQGAPEL